MTVASVYLDFRFFWAVISREITRSTNPLSDPFFINKWTWWVISFSHEIGTDLVYKSFIDIEASFFDYKIVQKFSKSVPDILWVTHPFSKFAHFCSFKLGSVHGHLNVRLFLVHLMPFYVRYTRILVTLTCYRPFSTLWTLDLIEIWVTDFRITDTISTLKMSIGNIPHPMII